MKKIYRGRVWKYGDHIDTDRIFPGKYTYTVNHPAECVPYVMEGLDRRFAREVRPGDIIVAGRNWGCGSSREQAVTSLKWAGIEVIIAGSFARIYYRNAINHALVPVICPMAHEYIEDGETIEVDLERSVIRCQRGVLPFDPLPEPVIRIISSGGLIPMLQERFKSPSCSDDETPPVKETP